jgi:hypothetical protein
MPAIPESTAAGNAGGEGRIAATTLSEPELRNIIRSLMAPRAESGVQGRFAKLHTLIKMREHHFYGSPEADPRLPAPHAGDTEAFQVDTLRRVHFEMRRRLTENPYRIRCEPPRDMRRQRVASDDLERVLQLGLEQAEEREGISILQELADGMGKDCFGVLHWIRTTDMWPAVPEPQLYSSLDEIDEDEQSRYRPAGDAYEEKPESVLERDRHNKALAGFPFYIECPRADQIAFIEDRSSANGMGLMVYMRDVGLLKYRDHLRNEGIEIGTVSINQHSRRVAIYTERTKPATWEPSGVRPDDWGQSVTIAQIWTRDELYELVAPSERGTVATEWTLVKSGPHGYEMPPFAIIAADRTNSPDPARRYLPYLEGIYKLKPFVDYDTTVGRLLAHQIAMPFYWVKLSDGAPMFDDGGNRVVLSHNSAAAFALPPGAELMKVEFEMNPAFVEFLNRAEEQLQDAAPETGNVDIGASTQPWTIRLGQEIANAPVAEYKQSIARGIKTMVRNMALVMQKPAERGGIGEAVPVYARVKKGKVEQETLIAVDPADIVSVQIEVDIAPHSNAQTIAAQEHGRQLLNDPNVPYPTQTQYLEDYVHISDPDTQLATWNAEQMYRTRVEPVVVAQELAKKFAALIVLGPDGRFVGPGGMELSPEQVLAQNGASVQQPPPIDPSVQAEGQASTPLNDLNVPGTLPTQGLPV